jgi:hypothetical protein
VGAALVPFFLLPALTLSQSVLIAVAGNLTVAASAVVVARRRSSAEAGTA